MLFRQDRIARCRASRASPSSPRVRSRGFSVRLSFEGQRVAGHLQRLGAGGPFLSPRAQGRHRRGLPGARAAAWRAVALARAAALAALRALPSGELFGRRRGGQTQSLAGGAARRRQAAVGVVLLGVPADHRGGRRRSSQSAGAAGRHSCRGRERTGSPPGAAPAASRAPAERTPGTPGQRSANRSLCPEAEARNPCWPLAVDTAIRRCGWGVKAHALSLRTAVGTSTPVQSCKNQAVLGFTSRQCAVESSPGDAGWVLPRKKPCCSPLRRRPESLSAGQTWCSESRGACPGGSSWLLPAPPSFTHAPPQDHAA